MRVLCVCALCVCVQRNICSFTSSHFISSTELKSSLNVFLINLSDFCKEKL